MHAYVNILYSFFVKRVRCTLFLLHWTFFQSRRRWQCWIAGLQSAGIWVCHWRSQKTMALNEGSWYPADYCLLKCSPSAVLIFLYTGTCLEQALLDIFFQSHAPWLSILAVFLMLCLEWNIANLIPICGTLMKDLNKMLIQASTLIHLHKHFFLFTFFDQCVFSEH